MNEQTLQELTSARMVERVGDARLERLARQSRSQRRRVRRRLDLSLLLYLFVARRDATP
jgi:hypothetical protein